MIVMTSAIILVNNVSKVRCQGLYFHYKILNHNYIILTLSECFRY
jgi:hypothetical protein